MLAPNARPVTVVVAEPVVTDTPLVLVHVPPATRSVIVTEEPKHTVAAPIMLEGTGLTVTTTKAGTPATV